MLGHEFVTYDGARIAGVGVLDVVTRGQAQRLIGNNYVDTTHAGRLVGYGNHSGLTTLGPGAQPLGRTQPGRGNNGRDGLEGAIRDNVIRDFLSLIETVHPGTLDGADVHENILAAVIRLDEAKAFLAVEPLYGSLRHETLLSGTCLGRPRNRVAGS